MDPSTTTPLLGFYVTIIILGLMVAYAGFEGTMRVFTYLDLQLRYFIIQTQMKFLGWKLKRQLIKDTKSYEKFLKDYPNE
jgi:hypothetical protein